MRRPLVAFSLCLSCSWFASANEASTPVKPIKPAASAREEASAADTRASSKEGRSGKENAKEGSKEGGKESGKESGKAREKEAAPMPTDELAAKIADRLASLRKEKEEVARASVRAGAPRVYAPALRRPVASAAKSAPAEAGHAHVHWSYQGEGAPLNWGKLDPANSKCDSGERQSPIDIREGIRVDLERIGFDYRPAHFSVIDNGHAIQTNLGAGNYLSVMGRTYELVQFHFHRPSEERINGKSFEMVVHLVHKDPEDRLAVVAILIERGKAHGLVQTVLNNLPLEKNETLAPAALIDVNQLLPVKREYYTYMGSLTTPPCTEGVLWMVMKEPIELAPEQLAIFARLYPMNARPVQKSMGRLIKESN